ncbi:hypothetical protein REJC140_01981 [Pseudorhizobium endolithicum]|uniref:Uncharacterized protein n=1 Tax=Pseudorhizobium endolithicum TaxID=1191678 RepID=A0ABM8PX73_9HYPH|nr:hypothetical protein REJC140_01981 [Pseudorhizobium endolithicum]
MLSEPLASCREYLFLSSFKTRKTPIMRTYRPVPFIRIIGPAFRVA